MTTEKTAIIRHEDGSTTTLQVAGRSAEFGLDVIDRWVVIPPDGFVAREGDELITNLAEGTYDWALPISDVWRKPA